MNTGEEWEPPGTFAPVVAVEALVGLACHFLCELEVVG